ncbi:NADH dehydrogenase subunit M [Thermodesulfitimonas autotrophica]|uniref:NADH dehydrogenase subunit M n=1 Tax=Thermodesulfitimonas autotrophica TaxID=1894989 RepID=A0A3N5AA74_9THEO|nr:NuoM family protein [Thermodesulfitimonas autotrophica]RPF42519.1 NADH dehydrogenase subunit M [Thermodesulfitimonas autotrophica]
MSFPVVSATVFAPLVGAALIFCLSPARKELIRWIAAVTTGISLVLAAYLVLAYDLSAGGVQFAEKINWLPSFGIKYFVGVDGISAVMLLLTAIVGFTGVFASWGIQDRVKEYYITFLALTFACAGVFASFDIFLLFVFFELAVLPKYILISVWGSTKKEYAAMKLALYLTLGGAITLLGILCLYFVAGINSLDLLELARHEFTRNQQLLLFAIFALGFSVQVPIVPLHSWLPDAHTGAPTAGSMILAGVVMKLGAYGIIRIACWLFPQGALFWAPVIAVLAIVCVVYAAFVAMGQKDLKYMIANSSISHMGYSVLGIAALTVASLAGALFQFFAHGIMAALNFAIAGMTYDRTHTRVIAAMGGLAKVMPVLGIAFAIGCLASVGLPGTASFWAEFSVFVGSFPIFPTLSILAISGIVFTAYYMLRALQRVYFEPLRHKEFAKLKDAVWHDWVVITVIVFFIVAMGVYPSLLMNLITSGLDPIMAGFKGATPVAGLTTWLAALGGVR